MVNGIVDEKIEELSKETTKNLSGNINLENEIKAKIRSIINEDEIKTNSAEINDLAKTIAKNLGIENSNDYRVEAKKIRIEIERWKEKNPQEVETFKKESFENKFEEETKKINPNLKAEELEKVKEYGKLLAETYASDNIIDDQKDEALTANNEIFSPGKIQNAWTDLKGITNFLTRKPEEIKEIKNKYESLKESLKGINLPNLKEKNSFENVISSFNNQGINETFSGVQKYLGWADRIDKLTGGWLNKTVTEAGLKMVSKIGNQAIQEFATNALNVMAEQGFQKGFETVLNGVLSGGVKAATTTAASGAAAGTGAAAAGTAAAAAGVEVAAGAAVSATGVGAIVVAALAAAKVLKKIGGKIADTLGVNFKKNLQETFGKVGGALISGAIFIVGLPALLIGTISMTVILPLIPIIIGGMFLYNLFNGSLISSLVTPEETIESESSDYATEEDTYEYISSAGPIVLPNVIKEKKTTGSEIISMARSLTGKVCYYWGGKSKLIGIDPDWGKTIKPDYRGRDIAGLDCSGFVVWVYYQFGYSLGSIRSMYDNYQHVSGSELQPGDIGIEGYENSGENGWHVGIFIGRDPNGKAMWIHSDTTYKSLGVCKHGYVGETNYGGFTKFARVL